MKRALLFFAAICTLIFTGCNSSKVTISGRFVGNENKSIYLEQSSTSYGVIIDSATLNESGNFSFSLNDIKATPTLYHLVCDGERVPLFIKGGDKIQVDAMGNITRNYTVTGSEESTLVREFYQTYALSIQTLDKLSAQYARAEGERKMELMKAYSEEFRRIKREQLRFVVSNKESLAAVYALYQRLPGDPYLFNEESDVIYFRTVRDAIAESYPESEYLTALDNDIRKMEHSRELIENIRETGFPELNIANIYGEKVSLSSLAGKVILLDFWSAELGNNNALNAELKQIYAKYADKGFEVYQVAIDLSKSIWINAVQEQSLPWISVSELQGQNALSLRLYQVQKLPSNFLIDRQGAIVERNIYGAELEKRIKELL